MKVFWLAPIGSQENRASCSSSAVEGSAGGSEQGSYHSPFAPHLPFICWDAKGLLVACHRVTWPLSTCPELIQPESDVSRFCP